MDQGQWERGAGGCEGRRGHKEGHPGLGGRWALEAGSRGRALSPRQGRMGPIRLGGRGPITHAPVQAPKAVEKARGIV